LVIAHPALLATRDCTVRVEGALLVFGFFFMKRWDYVSDSTNGSSEIEVPFAHHLRNENKLESEGRRSGCSVLRQAKTCSKCRREENFIPRCARRSRLVQPTDQLSWRATRHLFLARRQTVRIRLPLAPSSPSLCPVRRPWTTTILNREERTANLRCREDCRALRMSPL
jgi:hypothetical protein